MIKARLDRYLGLTVLGYVLLIAGCVMPIIILTGFEELWVSLTYNTVNGGMGDGFLIIGLLALSVPLVVLAKYRWLIIPAVLIFGILLIDFLDIQGSIFLKEYIFMPAWIVLFIGALSLGAVSVMDFMRKRAANGKVKNQPMMEAAA